MNDFITPKDQLIAELIELRTHRELTKQQLAANKILVLRYTELTQKIEMLLDAQPNEAVTDLLLDDWTTLRKYKRALADEENQLKSTLEILNQVLK